MNNVLDERETLIEKLKNSINEVHKSELTFNEVLHGSAVMTKTTQFKHILIK